MCINVLSLCHTWWQLNACFHCCTFLHKIWPYFLMLSKISYMAAHSIHRLCGKKWYCPILWQWFCMQRSLSSYSESTVAGLTPHVFLTLPLLLWTPCLICMSSSLPHSLVYFWVCFHGSHIFYLLGSKQDIWVQGNWCNMISKGLSQSVQLILPSTG